MNRTRISRLLTLSALLLLLVSCGRGGAAAPETFAEKPAEPAVTVGADVGEAETGMQEMTQETEENKMAVNQASRFGIELPAGTDRNPERVGLHVEEGGEIRLAGEKFCGFGVNYFGAFAHYWYGDYDDQPFVEAFRKLREYGVDFIRMPFGGYWTDYYEAFERDPEEVLRYLDRIVEEAEAQKIGIIVSLFWHDTALPLHLGKHRSAMGDPDSETVRYAKDYASVIVSRYASSLRIASVSPRFAPVPCGAPVTPSK